MMKTNFFSKLFLFLLCTSQVSAYIFDFSNHTNYPLRVRIHLEADPSSKWYEATLQPQKEGQRAQHYFKFGADQGYNMGEAEWWKGGFCLKDVQVAVPLITTKIGVGQDGEELGTIEEVLKDEKGNVRFGPWRDVAITLVKSEGANAIIEAAAELGDGLQSLTKDIATTAIEYKTNKSEKNK